MTKVLVIEDEELIRESIVALLNEREFTAVGTGDGNAGLQLAKGFVPDLILCDVRMPGINGYEVLEALRQDPTTATIPLIFLTAEPAENIVYSRQVMSANGYLYKPFTIAQLLEATAVQLQQ